MVKKFDLTYPLLSDKENKVASQFGVVHCLPTDLRAIYLKLGADLERFNGDDSWTLPLTGRFIVTPQGLVHQVDVDPDYKIRPEPAGLLEILETCC